MTEARKRRDVVARIAAHAASAPEAVAVRQHGECFTYGDLVASASTLATHLRVLGAAPEVRVGVCVTRRPHAATAWVAVLASGAAVVPLDPAWPPSRRAAVRAAAGLDLVVVDEGTRGLDGLAGAATVDLSVLGRDTLEGSPRRALPVLAIDPQSAAYVFCTSGSTGVPKAVVVEHTALGAYLDGVAPILGIDQNSASLAFSAFGFDVSVEEILLPLSCGATVVMADEAARADPRLLEQMVAAHRVGVVNLPVAMLPLLDPASLPSVHTVVTGSESPAPEQVARWTGLSETGGRRRRFLNGYGTTETVVTSLIHQSADAADGPVPIGYPVDGCVALVVDEALELVADGVAGELLIGGEAVARGYLGDPVTTAQRFVPDHLTGRSHGRLYRTGDLVSRDPAGPLTFLGRVDRQVKIRGQRVEPAEVEATLTAHPLVTSAAVEPVSPNGSPSARRLVAFCTPADAPADDLVEWCRDRLPASMVPAAVVGLDALPLTASGKIDRTALRAMVDLARPTEEADVDQSLDPLSAAESLVAAEMSKLLGHPINASSDDFFDHGGHSIAAMQLASLLREGLGRAVSVEDVYSGRTVAGIAERATAAERDHGDAVPSGSAPQLSDPQRRLWFLDRLADDTSAYNIDVLRELTGPVDAGALAAALTAVQERHEVLRWRIRETDDGLGAVDVAPPTTQVPLALHDLTEPGARSLASCLAEQSSQRFDLTHGPLWAASLWRTGHHAHVLALTFHHAVFDGWSERPVLEDLASAYRQAASGVRPALSPLPATFADYVAWKRRRDAARGADDVQWWVEKLSGAPEVTDVPTDRPRPPVQTYRGQRVATWLDPAERQQIDDLAATWAVGAPALFLTALGELCHRVCGQDDLVVGTPVADRRHESFWDLVGFFVEVVPVRFRRRPERTFHDAVRDRSAAMTEALGHPSAPFESVVAALGLRRSPSRQPLVQVLFNAFTFPESGLDLPGVADRRLDDEPPGSPFDLTVYVAARDDRYLLELVYNPDLFDRQRMDTFVEAYRDLLMRLCSNPKVPVGNVHVAFAALRAGFRQSTPSHGEGPAAVRAAPGTPSEVAVAAVWREVLDCPVGVTDNFFDLGGTSLAALSVQAGLVDRLGQQVPLVDLFRFPTVRSLAAHLDGSTPTSQSSTDRGQARAAARRQRRAHAARRGSSAHREIG